MNTKSRITSILKTPNLDASITGFQLFELSDLDIPSNLDFPLPSNLRLGHLAEYIVSELIKSSANYNVLYENLQITEAGKTVGELDFIIEHLVSTQLIHLELAYKFYLFDPTISAESINNWIGPNRNDSLKEKLEKLKRKQFPLLYQECTKANFGHLKIDEISQALCLLVSLFIPYTYKEEFNPGYEKAIKGYYLSLETFTSLDHSTKSYHLPPKKEWGIDPAENEIWTEFSGVEKYIKTSMVENQAVLCWQKDGGAFTTFFIVWW